MLLCLVSEKWEMHPKQHCSLSGKANKNHPCIPNSKDSTVYGSHLSAERRQIPSKPGEDAFLLHITRKENYQGPCILHSNASRNCKKNALVVWDSGKSVGWDLSCVSFSTIRRINNHGKVRFFHLCGLW